MILKSHYCYQGDFGKVAVFVSDQLFVFKDILLILQIEIHDK